MSRRTIHKEQLKRLVKIQSLKGCITVTCCDSGCKTQKVCEQQVKTPLSHCSTEKYLLSLLLHPPLCLFCLHHSAAVLLSKKVSVTDTDDRTWKRRKCYPYSDIVVRTKQRGICKNQFEQNMATELTIKTVCHFLTGKRWQGDFLSCQSEHSSNDTV